jgi:hypothetical protein
MNTQTTVGISPSAVRISDDHLIPAQAPILLPLIAQLVAERSAVLEKWNRKFSLDLRWPGALTGTR